MRYHLKKPSVLPGFGVTLGFTLFWLGLIVLLPLSALLVGAAHIDAAQFWKSVSSSRVVAAYRVTFTTAFIAAFLNVFIGLVIAWVLVRYRFPGKRLLDAVIDLPFALPTAVAGIALTALYVPNGWIGELLAPLGIRPAFSPIGITIALIFVGLPFVVRGVQPVLEDLDPELEEAAMSLGASRVQAFTKVLLPYLFPSLLAGFAMAFARGLGEYGSVIFIAGNMPMKSEIVPLLIVTRLEQFDMPGATALAVVMLGASFAMLLVINILQRWASAKGGSV